MGRKGQHYMTPNERYRLEAYLRAGRSMTWIASTMGFDRKTIYNERQRGQVQLVRKIYGYDRDVVEYSADKAQQIHEYNQTAKGRPIKLGNHHAYAQRLEDLMLGRQPDGTIDKRKRYSPYAALIVTRQEKYPITLCTATLYSYIEKGIFLHLTNKDLWEKGKRKKRGYHQVQRIPHPLLPSIADRPKAIDQRTEPGHWEMDLVIGGKKSKEALLTLTERTSRQEAIFKIPDKKATSVIAALMKWELARQGRVKSITTDNGSEFLRHTELTHALRGADIYYCHSYAAWEKGTNERHNRMIRRWFPKGTKFTKVKQKELDELTEWLNNYPRRELGGLTPNQVYI